MHVVEIPPFIDEKIGLASKTKVTNGYTAKDSLLLEVGNESVFVNRIKGGLKKMSCAVFNNPQNGEYYKVGGTLGMTTRIKHEYLGISTSLSINGLNFLMERLRLLNPEENSINLPIVRSPYLGCTLELLLRLGDNDERFSEYVFSVYNLAFLQANEMLARYGIFVSDPNPGNIVLRKIDSNKANIIFIDFSDSSFYRDPNYKNEMRLQSEFQKKAELVRLK